MLLGFTGCGHRQEDNVIADVNGQAITIKDFQAELARLPRQDSNQAMESKFVLHMLIERKLLAAKAMDEKIKPQDNLSGVSSEDLRASAYRQKLETDLQASDAEIQTYYAAHQSYYQEPVESGHEIMVPTLAQAKSIEGLLKSGTTFKDAAWIARGLPGQPKFDVSVIRPFRKGDRSPDYEKAFFSCSPGKTSDIVKIGSEYYILQRGQPRTKVPDSDIKQEIRRLLTQKAVTKTIENMIAAANVRIDQDKLAQLSSHQ